MKKMLFLVVSAVIVMMFSAPAMADLATGLSVVSNAIPAGPDSPGGASAGTSSAYSGYNPASIATCTDKAGASLNYLYLNFKNGPTLHIFTETVQAKLPLGVIQASYMHGDDTGLDHTRIAVAPGVNADAGIGLRNLQIFYGVEVSHDVFHQGDKLLMGVSAVPFSESKLNLSAGSVDLLESKSSDWSAGGGVSYVYDKDIIIGAYYTYTGSHVKDFDFTTGEVDASSCKEHQLQIGASYKVTDWLMLAGDVQYLNINGIEKVSPFVGAELSFFGGGDCLTGGYAGHGPMVGLGVYPSENYGVAVSYSYDMAREVKAEFGRADLVSALAFVTF